ncbi:MAG TPA: hypothetical protein VML55_00485, partial [Planctomycetaceae bacterium]|nr:hypothetical protein [Planctomycetaceae bacterium]
MSRSLLAALGVVLGVVLGPAWASAGEIGFLEEFALSPDRSVPLRQLIPGTEDYYYYHCLHAQHTERFEKADELAQAWIKRHGYTPRVYEILNRQALLTWEKNPQKSLAYLRERLNLQFNHQRQLLDAKPNLPTALDQKLISREALVQRAFGSYENLQGVEDAALDWLIGAELNPDRRRHLLERLQRPDHEGLVKLIAADLDYRYSGGFGSFTIHRQLLRAQLEELLKLKPELLNQQNVVHVYLSKLRPHADEDWRHDKPAFAAYLDRLWAFVSKLAPVHNSLKAHVLYHRLVLDRSRGEYDKERFLTYIRLPRNVGYIQPRYMQLDVNRRHPADLNADFSGVTLLPPVGDDEPLVRSYLADLFVTETAYKPYETYISDEYLKRVFAETKILNGLGEPEQWYSLLDPAEYQALKDRVDLEFAHTNAAHFGPGDVVALDLDVKNVRTLIVKVFELNTRNYYTERLSEIDTDIDLDGLVPNSETTHQYSEPPLRRVRRHFEFPELKDRGVYVIDFIGNGQSSRVVVRKGKLHFVSRTSTAGHVFTILDERDRPVPGASLLLGGHEYRAGEDGTLTVPFSTQPGRQPVVLVAGDFASLDHFQHEAENYELSAGIYVDRESLLARRTASVLVRPGLKLNGTPVTLRVLEEPQLVITSTGLDGIVTTKEVPLVAAGGPPAARADAPAANEPDNDAEAPDRS